MLAPLLPPDGVAERGAAEEADPVKCLHPRQIHLFLDAERLYGFNDIVDWMKYGTDDRLVSDDLWRERNVELPRTAAKPATNSPLYNPAPAPVPDTLVLRRIYWARERPAAMINNHTLGVNEEGNVRVGTTNVTIRCVAIRQDSVRIRIVGSGEEQELRINRHAR